MHGNSGCSQTKEAELQTGTANLRRIRLQQQAEIAGGEAMDGGEEGGCGVDAVRALLAAAQQDGASGGEEPRW